MCSENYVNSKESIFLIITPIYIIIPFVAKLLPLCCFSFIPSVLGIWSRYFMAFLHCIKRSIEATEMKMWHEFSPTETNVEQEPKCLLF